MRVHNAGNNPVIKSQYIVYNIALLLSFLITFKLLYYLVGKVDIMLCREQFYCGSTLNNYVEWWKVEVMPLLAITVFFWLPMYQEASNHKRRVFILAFPLLLACIIMAVNIIMHFPSFDFYEQYLYFITLLLFLIVLVFILQILEVALKFMLPQKYLAPRD